MENPPLLSIYFSLSLLLLNYLPILPLATSTTPPTNFQTTLDPKQVRALQSLNIPTSPDPCSNPPSLKNATVCENSSPFRHLVSLHLIDCSSDVSLSYTALKSLSTLQELSFINCPANPTARFPIELASNLRSFTCINSLRRLNGDMLSQLQNVINLTVSSVPINATGPSMILDHLTQLSKLIISHANLNGFLPKSWNNPNIYHIDLSYNQLKGNIPSSITELENLVSLDLTGNQLTGELPTSIGDLIGLKKLSLSTNSLSGPIPGSMSSMPELQCLDLSSNQLNGAIPHFLVKLKGLKYLNLEKNNFQGIMPFSQTFINQLDVFKIGHNVNLCYNYSSVSPDVKLGIAPCDKNGLPLLPPDKTVPSGDDEGDSDYSGDNDDASSEGDTGHKSNGHHGPNKVVLGLAIAISSIVFLIIFLILLAKRFAL